MLKRENEIAMFIRMTTIITTALAMGLVAHGQVLHDSTPASIQGTVLGEDGRPLASATVYAYSDMRKQIHAASNAKGNFLMPDAPTGVVYIDAFKETDGYPNNFFAFHKAIGEELHKIAVEPGAHIQGLVIRLGPRAATIHLEITESNGAPVAGGVVEFKREDNTNTGSYSDSAKPSYTTLVPSLVPFRFAVTVPGYKAWESQSMTAQPGETLNIAVHLDRQ
jgi:hypothetical protein